MIKKILLKCIFITLFIIFYSNPSFASQLIIANFDRGEKPNLISGDFGAWNKTEVDRTQFCRESFTTRPGIVYGGKGCSLQLDYDVDSPNEPAYNGFWMRLEKIDLTPYKNLVFFVKGDKKFGYTTKFKVELKNMEGLVSTFLVEGVNDNWQKVTIPLTQMKQAGNWHEAKEFVIIFEDRRATKKVGRIYIDQIYLE